MARIRAISPLQGALSSWCFSRTPFHLFRALALTCQVVSLRCVGDIDEAATLDDLLSAGADPIADTGGAAPLLLARDEYDLLQPARCAKLASVDASRALRSRGRLRSISAIRSDGRIGKTNR